MVTMIAMQMILVAGEREGICSIFSNPCELYTFTLAFEQMQVILVLGGEEREGSCKIMSSPCKLYSWL